MPRRKKSNLERKPSLMFTESPVHIQNNVPSPVFCARCPPTASTVPIEDLDALSWVSPQFQSTSHSCIKTRRMLRQRRHSLATHGHVATLSTTKEGTHSNGPLKTMRKYQSLKFLGEKSIKPSILEDIEITVDSDSTSENEMGHDSINENDQVTRPPIKRLFANGLDDRLTTNLFDDCNVVNDNEPCSIPYDVVHSNNQMLNQLEEIPETSEEEKENWLHRPRRSTRLRHLQKLLIMDEASQKETRVLAPDTPESEYGLTMRQRQLARLRSKRL